ncbi:MAG TPA: hypothetical protein PKC21_07615 [Oligoflexia bacterium]|nr:hypothetical protein [Oligoflexia bacterium]HMR25204.1 hypothetical protein [Oligoflexia bacterium]
MKKNIFLAVSLLTTAGLLNACSNVSIGDPNTFTQYEEVIQEPLIDQELSFSQSEINDLCQDLDNYPNGVHPDSVTPTVTNPVNGQENNSNFRLTLLSSYAIFNSVYVEIKINPIGQPASFLRLDDGYKVLINGRQLPYKESTNTNVGYYSDYIDLRPINKANVCIIDPQGGIRFQQIRMPEAVSFINYRTNDTSTTFEEGVNIEFSPAYPDVRGNVCIEQCILSYAIRPAAPGVMSFNFNTLRDAQYQEAQNIQANPSDSIRRLSYSFRNLLNEETPILGFGNSEITASTTSSLYLYYPYIP